MTVSDLFLNNYLIKRKLQLSEAMVPIISIGINNSSQHFARCEAGKAKSADSSRRGEIRESCCPRDILLSNGAGSGTI